MPHPAPRESSGRDQASVFLKSPPGELNARPRLRPIDLGAESQGEVSKSSAPVSLRPLISLLGIWTSNSGQPNQKHCPSCALPYPICTANQAVFLKLQSCEYSCCARYVERKMALLMVSALTCTLTGIFPFCEQQRLFYFIN
jgi:hypothetical protein